MFFSYFIADHEPYTFWKKIMDTSNQIHIMDVIMVVGLLYLVVSYYSNYAKTNDASKLVVYATRADDDSTRARGDRAHGDRPNFGSDSGRLYGNNRRKSS